MHLTIKPVALVAEAIKDYSRRGELPPQGLRGCAGATLLAHGFRVDMIAGLVHDGLATAHCETMRVGKRKNRRRLSK
jgi:hypothetical protein